MEKADLMSELQDIVRAILDNNAIILEEDTTVDEIEDWDSLTHVQLDAKIEEKYGVKLTLKEMLSWETIGELAECLASKI